MDPQATVTVVDRGGTVVARPARTLTVSLALAATVAALVLIGLGSGPRHHTPAAQRIVPIPPFVGVRFDTRLDGDEGQSGGRRPDADDH